MKTHFICDEYGMPVKICEERDDGKVVVRNLVRDDARKETDVVVTVEDKMPAADDRRFVQFEEEWYEYPANTVFPEELTGL